MSTKSSKVCLLPILMIFVGPTMMMCEGRLRGQVHLVLELAALRGLRDDLPALF